MKADYGIDAPGLVKTFFIVAAVAIALIVTILIYDWPKDWSGLAATTIFAIVGFYTLGMGCFMVNYSHNVKLVDREHWLDMLNLSGTQQVLDLGCGRGLMMIGAAKRLKRGRAFGIDLWSEKDQAGNGPEALMENARIEGVGDRIEVRTGDMRELPFAAGAFDTVMSHWALHNIDDFAGRAMACSEAHRVLRQGGEILIADIENHDEYVSTLQKVGFTDVKCVGKSRKTDFAGLISFGSFRPMAVYGRKI